MHDFQRVAGLEPGLGVAGARHDRLVALYRHLACLQPERGEQGGDGYRSVEGVGFAIQCQSHGGLHARIMGTWAQRGKDGVATGVQISRAEFCPGMTPGSMRKNWPKVYNAGITNSYLRITLFNGLVISGLDQRGVYAASHRSGSMRPVFRRRHGPAAGSGPGQSGNQGTVGVITGMEGGTYARTAADLTILDDGTLRVLPILGKGSLQNLSDILYLKGVDIGFVQADALAYAQQHGMFPNLTQKIRYSPAVRRGDPYPRREGNIRLEDLNGQRVNVDVTGSGSAMTAEIVLDALGIKAKVEHEKQVTGVQELKHGDIAAVIHVGGAPIPLFADISADSGIHFLPIELNQALAQTYLPDQFTHDNYPLLVPAGTQCRPSPWAT